MPTTTTGKASEFITFSRTSNATLTDGDGKIKWAPHNLLLASEQFDAASWGKQQLTVTANSIAAPNGTTTADTIVENTTTNWHYINRNVTFTAGVTYTASAFLRAGTQTYGTINIYNSSSASLYAAASFNLSTGAVANSGVSGTGYSIVGSPSITPIGSSGWYLCSLTFVAGTTAPEYFTISTSDNGVLGSFGMTSYLGASKTIYAWGAHLYRSDLAMQLNTSAYPTYNPTTAKNLLGYSEDFSNAGWAVVTGTATKTSNTDIAPNGLQTADTLAATSADTIVWQTYVPVADCKYTGSIYLKRKSGSGTVQFTADGGTFTTITLTTTWQRFSATYTAAAGLKAVGVKIVTSGDEVYAWGAQLSDSASLDTYVPNHGAAPTAAAYYGPRLDFDPVTLAAKGLLVEEQRANLVLQSAAFNSVDWFTGGTTVSADVAGSTAIAPDGTNTADKLAEDNSTGTHRVLPVTALTVVSGSPYTYSVYAKAVERTKLVIVDNDVQGATFDLSAGTVSALGTGVTAPPPVAAGNGWYRCVITRSPTTTSGRIGIYLADGTGATSYTGVTGNGVLIWGAQVEAGSFATSYIPVGATSAGATRNADVASVSTQAFPYSSTEGTWVANFQTIFDTTNPVASSILTADGSASKLISYIGGGGNQVSSYDGATIITRAIDVTGPVSKAASAYNASGRALAVNGSAVATGTIAAGYSTVSTANIGGTVGTGPLNGWIRQITYLPRRISDAELTTRST